METISQWSIPDGVRLVAQPFSEPNKNADCEVIAEVKSATGDRRDVRITITNLKWMKLSDVPILMAALRSVMEKAQIQMPKVQEKAAQPKPTKKAKKKKGK
jgi:hypothetical protein